MINANYLSLLRTIFVVFFIPFFSFGQLTIESKQSAEFYVKNVLLGEGIKVGAIKFKGRPGSFGQFESDSSIIGVKSGVVLSTGTVDSIVGPNESISYTSVSELPASEEEMRLLSKGDTDLNKLCKAKANDICVVEFDFVPTNNVLEFKYVFGSDEYKEFVGSSFNDAFAFFVKGPGIKKKNVAILPDGVTPVTINTVNHKTNSQYFRRNQRKIGVVRGMCMTKSTKAKKQFLIDNIEFDGLTTVLKVHCDVIPYKKYHIKIGVADASDNAYDSGVFIEAGSFVSVKDTAGKYFEKIALYENKKINIDSLFGIKPPYTIETIPPVEIAEKYEITDVYFDFSSFSLVDSSKNQLDELAKYLLEKKALNCVLSGYTDNVGNKKFNQKLSEKRAIAVIEYLLSKGVERNRLDYIGNSFENPRGDNSTESGRKDNRRVEIILEE